jgi:hypothetical protein
MNKKKSFMNLIEDIEGLSYMTDPPEELYQELATLSKKIVEWHKKEEAKFEEEEDRKYGIANDQR